MDGLEQLNTTLSGVNKQTKFVQQLRIYFQYVNFGTFFPRSNALLIPAMVFSGISTHTEQDRSLSVATAEHGTRGSTTSILDQEQESLRFPKRQRTRGLF